MSNTFEPKILGFLCNWCSYAGADLAGVSRNQYPPNIRVIRVMCSGRVDPVFVVDALKKGIDGVLVLGCHLGDCHYLEGNFEAKVKLEALAKLLKLCGLDQRVALDWVSAAEGTYFAEIIKKFTDNIKALGPTPLSDPTKAAAVRRNLEAIGGVVSDNRFRKYLGKKRRLVDKGNVYGNLLEEREFDRIFGKMIEEEFLRYLIYGELKASPLSVGSVAKKLGYDKQTVFDNLLVLRQRGLVDLDSIHGLSPIYKCIN